jgi:hypothetical protein
MDGWMDGWMETNDAQSGICLMCCTDAISRVFDDPRCVGEAHSCPRYCDGSYSCRWPIRSEYCEIFSVVTSKSYKNLWIGA